MLCKEHFVRLLGIALAAFVLVFAGSAGAGSALACANSAGVDATVQTQQTHAIADAAPVVVAQPQRALPAVEHHHHAPGPHDHGSHSDCCMLCCGAAVPHVLLQEPVIFFARPQARGPGFASAAVSAQALAGLPFRPPRAL
jgi:hypothetical protein